MNPWRSLRGLPAQVWLVCAADFINRSGTMALVFLVPYLTIERHWSLPTASIAMSLYGVMRMACGLLTGPLIDRFGAVVVLKVSLVGTGLALGAIPFAPSPSPVPALALLAVWGAFSQASGPACMALLASLAPSEQRRGVFALQRLGANLGMSIGPALGGFLAHVRYDWVFWCNGGTALAAAVFVSARLTSVSREPTSATKHPSRSAWRDRRLLYLLFSVLPALLVFFQTEGTLAEWVVGGLQFDTRFLGVMFTLNTVIIVVVELALNLAMSKWPHRATFMLGATCLAVGFGSLALAHSAIGLFGAVVVWTFGEMILLPALSDAVASLAPAERRGGYMGLLSFTYSVGLAVGPALGILAYDRLGPEATWGGCFGLGMLSVLLVARIGNPTTSTSAAETPAVEAEVAVKTATVQVVEPAAVDAAAE